MRYRHPQEGEIPTHLTFGGHYFPLEWKDGTYCSHAIVQFESGTVCLSFDDMRIIFGPKCFRVGEELDETTSFRLEGKLAGELWVALHNQFKLGPEFYDRDFVLDLEITSP